MTWRAVWRFDDSRTILRRDEPNFLLSDEQNSSASALHPAPQRRLTLFGLICIAYFTTSGGAFGIEPLVGQVGAGWAIALILLSPVVWSLPMALMVAELATLLPDEGGYYIWV